MRIWRASIATWMPWPVPRYRKRWAHERDAESGLAPCLARPGAGAAGRAGAVPRHRAGHGRDMEPLRDLCPRLRRAADQPVADLAPAGGAGAADPAASPGVRAARRGFGLSVGA